jgi:hypothetical protein
MLDPIALERVLRAKWGALPGVYDVAVRPHQRRWAVIVSGPSPAAPPGITAVITINIGDRAPAMLPVFWRTVPAAAPRQLPYAEVKAPNRANEAMWAGVPPVVDRPFRVVQPIDTAPGIAAAKSMPKARLHAYQFFLPARTMELPFFSKPFNLRACICCNNLNVDQPVLTYAVKSDEQLIVQSVSYDVYNVPVSNQFRFRVNVSGQTLTQWDDIVVDLANGPSHQFALSGHLNPLPVPAYIEHDSVFTLSAKLLGPYPFASDPSYATTAQICISVQGVLVTINDARQGVPRPADLGDLNDVAQGFKDIVPTVTEAEIDAVQTVLDQAEYEVEHPANPQLGRR